VLLGATGTRRGGIDLSLSVATEREEEDDRVFSRITPCQVSKYCKEALGSNYFLFFKFAAAIQCCFWGPNKFLKIGKTFYYFSLTSCATFSFRKFFHLSQFSFSKIQWKVLAEVDIYHFM
jgi:hypothetical protein